MNSDILKAKQIFASGEFSCVFCSKDTVITEKGRGISPLLSLIDKSAALEGFSAADKIVGKAAALLYAYMKVRAVYAPVMSKGAEAVLKAHNIEVYYEDSPTEIINRQNTGLCPMEKAVLNVSSPFEAYCVLKEELRKLKNLA